MTGVDLPRISPGPGPRHADRQPHRRRSRGGCSAPHAGSGESRRRLRDHPAGRGSARGPAPEQAAHAGGGRGAGGRRRARPGVRLFAPTTSPAATLAPDAASPREPTTAAAAAPASEVVKLTVKVTPANARIMLDDALLSVGPFEGKLVKRPQATQAPRGGDRVSDQGRGGDCPPPPGQPPPPAPPRGCQHSPRSADRAASPPPPSAAQSRAHRHRPTGATASGDLPAQPGSPPHSDLAKKCRASPPAPAPHCPGSASAESRTARRRNRAAFQRIDNRQIGDSRMDPK